MLSEEVIRILDDGVKRAYDMGYEKGAVTAIEEANKQLEAAGIDYELIVFVV